MKNIKINATPVRTSRNFNINNFQLADYEIPKVIEGFKNVSIVGEDSKVQVESNTDSFDLTYGIGKTFENQIKKQANQRIKMTIDSKTEKEMQIQFRFDKQNKNLVEDIQIDAEPDTRETVIIKYETPDDKEQFYHNGEIKVFAKENSTINIIIVNLLNTKSYNFLSIENILEKNAKVKYTIIDFGGKNSITNYYSNLIGDNSENVLN